MVDCDGSMLLAGRTNGHDPALVALDDRGCVAATWATRGVPSVHRTAELPQVRGLALSGQTALVAIGVAVSPWVRTLRLVLR